jgi:fluoroacetyl-CoA thioesterase
VGIHIDVSHEAATPPGLKIKVTVELTEVKGKKLVFNVEAHDAPFYQDMLSQNDRLRSSMVVPEEWVLLSS